VAGHATSAVWTGQDGVHILPAKGLLVAGSFSRGQKRGHPHLPGPLVAVWNVRRPLSIARAAELADVYRFVVIATANTEKITRSILIILVMAMFAKRVRVGMK
jgi:hypothetical protein